MRDILDIRRLSLAGAYDFYESDFQNQHIIPVTIWDRERLPASQSSFTIRLPQPAHIAMHGALAMALPQYLLLRDVFRRMHGAGPEALGRAGGQRCGLATIATHGPQVGNYGRAGHRTIVAAINTDANEHFMTDCIRTRFHQEHGQCPGCQGRDFTDVLWSYGQTRTRTATYQYWFLCRTCRFQLSVDRNTCPLAPLPPFPDLL